MSDFVTERAKMLFASKLLNEKAKKIYGLQEQAVTEWNLFDSGNLKKSLAGRGNFTVRSDENTASASLRYLAYTRFLDMRNPRRRKQREGYHLYNRILFGILYNEILPGLQYGYLPEIKAQTEAEIKQAMAAGYIDDTNLL